MRIAVNTRLLIKNQMEGIGWFTYESLKRITRDHPEHQFYFFFDRSFDKDFIFSENVVPVKMGPPARHAVLFYAWFGYTIPWLLRKHKIDLFVSPDGYLSISTKVKTLLVIHDIAYIHFPQYIPPFALRYLKVFFPKFVKRADRIATVSEYSKSDIIQHFGKSGNDIDIVYNGCNESFGPVDDTTKAETRKKFTDGKDYFLFIGMIHPRKNVNNLLKAFGEFKERSGSEAKLVIAGRAYWGNKEIEETYNHLPCRGDIIFTGRVSSEDLKNLLGSALALTYVSRFEGFGIPILEAMTCDIPVITSNTSSMPEVAGDAALLVDPASPSEIAGAMTRIASEPMLRNELIKKGRKQKQQFSWEKTAALLYESMLKTALGKKETNP